MTNPTEISNTILMDTEGRHLVVRRGDKVDLRSINLISDEEERYLANENRDFLRRWLGQGPYTITDIGKWPCGRIMIYLETESSHGSGVYAEDLVFSNSSPSR